MNSSGVDVSIDKDHVAVADSNTGDLRDITKEELDQVAYGQPTIRFMDEDDKRFTVYAPEGKTHFTVSDLLDAIVAFEQHNKAAIFSWATGIFGKATENLIDFTLSLTHIVLLVAAALGCLPCGLRLCTCVLGSKQAGAQLACAAVAAVLIAGTRSF
eukprot:3451-Heterococcus_DN1.PRE.4